MFDASRRPSPHFSRAELLTTSKPYLVAPPTPEQWLNAQILATALLEPLRSHVGPIKVNSWLRSPALNAAVGGVSSSHHLTGSAVDVQPIRVDRRDMWEAVLALHAGGMLFSEAIIYEAKSHIHLSYMWRESIIRPKVLVKPARGRMVRWDSYRGPLK